MKFQDNHHFCHPHFLNELNRIEGQKVNCEACEQLITEPFHGCMKCSYYVHDDCLNKPRSLEHPSHPSHPLTLLPIPTYASRSYICNACGSQGNAFSYSCAHCQFDLHIQCASLPKTAIIENHPHELTLTFDYPIRPNTMCSCDVCHGAVDTRQWVYRCAKCDFDAHLDCANAQKLNNVMNRHCLRGKETESENSTLVAEVKMMEESANSMLTAQREMLEVQLHLQRQAQMANISAGIVRNAVDASNLSRPPKYKHYTSPNNYYYI